MERIIKRGDIYYAELNPVIGSEQGGTRPVLIISNDVGNKHSPTVIVAPITSRIHTKAKLPTHTLINDFEGLDKNSIILLEQVYGYELKAFNQQVKRNIERFQNDMMFQLSDDEVEYLRSQFVTANISCKSRSNPYVFTEQGVYMLMTVLKGELAVRQSIALVRTFKKMKDYILENRDLIGQREMLQLSMETANNRIEINKINSDMISLEKQISDVAEGLKDVITKSELADMMNSFVSDDDDKWLMFNAKFSSADEVYESIYKQAKSSIYVVDNYIGLRTLVHLKNSPIGVNITLFSDNVGNNKLHNIEFTDFCKEYPSIKISLKKTGGIFHDRFIVLDYGTADERVFLCGASSKDAGARITGIVEDYGIFKYAPVIATLLKNPTLILPQ